MKADLQALIEKLLTRPTVDELRSIASGLTTTTYSLNGNISDYDLIQITALSTYSNRWVMTIPTDVFTSSTTQSYYTSLGTEYSIYNLAVKYASDTSITVLSKGTGTIGMIVKGIRL